MTEWAYRLAESLLADSLPKRWAHCLGVAERARLLAPILGSDAELLECAAVLHDIGYSPEVARTGFHSLDGARYLRDETDTDKRIVALVAHHSIAWREADARGVLSELEAEFPADPELHLLADALCFSDMNTTPDGLPTNPVNRVQEIADRYGPESLIGRFIRQAEPEILAASARILVGLSDNLASATAQPM